MIFQKLKLKFERLYYFGLTNHKEIWRKTMNHLMNILIVMSNKQLHTKVYSNH